MDEACLYPNGYSWKRWSETARSSYIAAYGEGVQFVLMKLLATGMIAETSGGKTYRELMSGFIPPMAPESKTDAALEDSYATSENLKVPINYRRSN